jgi:hypothetical protein
MGRPSILIRTEVPVGGLAVVLRCPTSPFRSLALRHWNVLRLGVAKGVSKRRFAGECYADIA